MVHLERAEPVRRASYLDANHRPTVGGVAIDMWNSSRSTQLGGCSLGFNARISGDSHEYFVTAGHCTQTQNSTEYSVVFQAYRYLDVPYDSAIGIEYSDPPQSSGIPGCPGGSTCRYSDAALFQYTIASFSNFAYLAKDSSFSSTFGTNGSRFRVDSFHVVNDVPEASLLAADTVNYDTYMHKVGNTTGWTWGPIRHTCVTVINSGGKLLCQYFVRATANNGDSGSPTFWWQCCGTNEAWLGGVLWGLTGADYLFGSISGIKNDFSGLVSY